MQEFKIAHLGRQGDGVAHGPVYAPQTLPGELVTGQRDGDVLTGVKIVTPSSDRVRPPCKHFKACGGCQMQHAADPLVAAWKQDIVATALRMNGIETDVRPIATSPERSRRRAKFAARRTKSGAIAGFHGRASGTVVDVQDCVLVSPTLSAAPDVARQLAKIGASRKAEISVQCTETLDGLDVDVTGGLPLTAELIQALSAMASQSGVARLTWDGELVAQISVPRHPIGAAHIGLPPAAFLQATDHGESTLQKCVADAVAGCGAVVDLFAGCGTFALHLAQSHPVHAVEGDAAMTDACQSAANHTELPGAVTTETRDLFRNPLLPDELQKFDAIVLDPPRAGAAAQVTQIAASRVPIIAYVSCDPGSFARDATTLVEAGYILKWVQPVDQFRWSAHVELAARFELSHMQGAQ